MNTGIVLTYILGFFLVLALVLLRQNRKLNRTREMLRTQEEALLSQVSLLQAEQEKLERSKKEIREMVSAWMKDGQAEVDSVHELQVDILKDMKDEENTVYWCDPVLNTLFLRKLEECRECGVEVTVTGFPENGIPMIGKSIAEMIGLFSNLFDNAIEACRLLPEGERWVHFSVRQNKKRWIFTVENSRGEKSCRRQGEKTWKKDKEEHGIGKDIICDIVNRNRGWIEFSEEADIYRVSMMLPASAA